MRSIKQTIILNEPFRPQETVFTLYHDGDWNVHIRYIHECGDEIRTVVNSKESAIRQCRAYGEGFTKLLLRNARLGDALVSGVFDAVAEWADIADLQSLEG